MVLEIIKFGIINGILLAFISLGFALIFNILKIVDFTHMDRITVSAYMFILFNLYLNIYISIFIAILICIIITFIIERYIYFPLRKDGITTIMFTSFGLSLIIQSILGIIFSSTLKVSNIIEKPTVIFQLYPREILLLPLLILSYSILFIWLKFGISGKSLRAMISNYERAIFLRIPVKRLQTIVFIISAVMASFTGIFIAIGSGITPSSGFKYLIFSFSASVTGGLKNLIGTLISSILLGVIISFAEAYGTSLASEAIALGLLVLILYFKPEGIFKDKTRII